MLKKVYILFGILDGKIQYYSVFSDRKRAEQTKETIIKGDTYYGFEGWEYFITDEIVK